MIYQCTQDLLKILAVEKCKKPEIYNELLSWHVKLMKVGRRNLIYMMNDASKLSVILFGLTVKNLKKFDDYAKEGIKKVLEDCSVSDEIISLYLEEMTNAIYTSTGTRKQLGVLNRAGMELAYLWEDFEEENVLQRQLSKHQNEGIIKNSQGDYVTPQVIAKNLLNRTFGNHRVVFDLEKIALHMYTKKEVDKNVFLNIQKGSMVIEDSSETNQTLRSDEDYILLQHEAFDFFSNFKGFAVYIEDERFLVALDQQGHGEGAVARIKALLFEYPEVEQQWYAYENEVQKNKVKAWLASRGLM